MLRHTPIRLKLMLITLLTCTSVMALMGGAFFVNEYLTLRQIMVRQLAILGEVLSANSTAALAFENRDDAREILQALKAEPHVTGAAPFASGEVMLSSATNLATGILRGIDAALIGKVNDLPENLEAGKIEYLSAPEKLLDLPPSLLQTTLLPSPKPAADAGVPEPADAGVADAGTGKRTSGELKAEVDRLQKKIDDIEAFLREPTRAGPKPRDVLPGIIVGKELGNSYGIEVGYVGRRGRNLLVRRDLAMPLNLTDPASGVDYFTAARQLLDAYTAAGGDVSLIGRIPYWENMFPDAAFDGFTATQNMAAEFGGVYPDAITALYNADQACFPACSRFGPYAFFAEEAAFRRWISVGVEIGVGFQGRYP